MTAATELLGDLRSRGVVLRAKGDRLRAEAPPGVLTPGLRQVLAARKPELLGLLAAEAAEAERAITAALEPGGPGWIAVHARALGGALVLFVRDAHAAVPSEIGDVPRFCPSELEILAARPPSAPDLDAIVKAKEVFLGATIVAAEWVGDGRRAAP